MIILPLNDKESFDEDDTRSWYLMKAQEQNGSVKLLKEPEEDAWRPPWTPFSPYPNPTVSSWSPYTKYV
jgi:hypothetical protein